MTAPTVADRNIVLVTVDSLRADYCYSSEVPTPSLDALADSGYQFYDLSSDPAEQAGKAVNIESLHRESRARLTEIAELERATREELAVSQL